MKLKYFTLSEFDSPDEPGSGDQMQEDFLKLLDKARKKAGIPFMITSGYRTAHHNEKVGGKLNSAHPRGWAADIKADNSRNRMKIMKACLDVGFVRVGFMRNAIHVDCDPDLPQDVLWHYYK